MENVKSGLWSFMLEISRWMMLHSQVDQLKLIAINQDNIKGVPAKMEAQVDTLRLLAQPEEGQQFKNKKQPELTENRTA